MNWPLFTKENVQLGQELSKLAQSFEFFYKSTHKNRTLQWVYQYGSASIVVTTPKVIQVETTVYQACVLLLFNQKSKWTLKEIIEELKISENHLEAAIFPMIKSKYHLLTASSPNQGSPLDLLVEINENITKYPNKVCLPAASIAAFEQETLQSRESINEDRRFQVDAAIVRIMKSRRRVKYQDLISEVTEQLLRYFKPDIKFLKQRVEVLSEQEFIARDLVDPTVYNYLA